MTYGNDLDRILHDEFLVEVPGKLYKWPRAFDNLAGSVINA